MPPLNNWLSAILIFTALSLALIGFYSLQARRTSLRVSFALLCFSAALYTFSYGMELSSSTFTKMLLWNGIEYLGIPYIASFWLMLALQYSGRGPILTRSVIVGIFMIPVITMVLRYSYPHTHFLYQQVTLINNGYFPVLNIIKGPWYLVHTFYITVTMLYSTWLYLQLYLTTTGKVRQQALIMLAASILPWVFVYPSVFNKSPLGLDLNSWGMTISIFFLMMGLFRFDFLNIKPLARDNVFTAAEDGILVFDLDDTLVDYNPTAQKLLQLFSHHIGKRKELVLTDYPTLHLALSSYEDTIYTVNANDKIDYYRVRITAIQDEQNKKLGSIMMLTDITEHFHALEHLNILASTDALTGIYNRRAFIQRGNQEVERAQRYGSTFSIILLDIDYFKEINDQFGHQAGDLVLQKMVDICRGNIRSIDLLARYGGDELIILLPETTAKSTCTVGNRIAANTASQVIPYNNTQISITVSMGVAGFDANQDECLDDLLKRADQALYTAKAQGRNKVILAP